jgi:hypothetical protein
MLFKKIITLYSENHLKPIQKKQLFNIKEDGIFSYHWFLKG